MLTSRLVIVMPAYNEAEGITGFLDEIRTEVAPLVAELMFVVADDRSTDDTVAALRARDDVQVAEQETNRGHGPTALAAYRAGLALNPDVLIHVDGDGQFLGRDFPRLLRAFVDENADVVHGVRIHRTDPWYRRALTAAVGSIIALFARRRVPDVNTPLRAYRPAVLQALLEVLPDEALVPHVHLSLAEALGGFRVRYLRVQSIPRRGASATGTMWGAASTISLPPARLRRFAGQALSELWNWSLRPGAPLRRVRGLSGAWIVRPATNTADAASSVATEREAGPA